jgi:hypothetical protein
MKVVKFDETPKTNKRSYYHPVQKFHVVEAKDEVEVTEKIKAFYEKKGNFEVRNIDVEPLIK